MTSSVKHLCEKLLGLPHDYLTQQGEWSLKFNPAWPGQAFLGVEFWNVLLAVVAGLLVFYVYTRDGRSRPLRIMLGLLRGSLLALILFLLNRPILTLGQTDTKPSVLAVLIDDSGSMQVPDVGDTAKPVTRLSAVQSYLDADRGKLLNDLARKHNLRIYKFDRTAVPLTSVEPAVEPKTGKAELDLTTPPAYPHWGLAVWTGSAAGLYLLAAVLMGIGTGQMRWWAMGVAVAGLAVHTVAITLRFLIVRHGGWPDGDFARVLYSPAFGVTLWVALGIAAAGIGVDLWRRTGAPAIAGILISSLALLALVATAFLYTSDTQQHQTVRLKAGVDVDPSVKAIDNLKAEGESTQVLPSILTVMQDLQGQAVAGVVVLTDGRDTPARKSAEALESLKNYGVKVYPVAVGSDNPPKNIEVENMQVEEAAFKGDVLNVKGIIHVTGYEKNHQVTVHLIDKATGKELLDPDGKPVTKQVTFPDDKPVEVELQWKTADPGNKDISLEAVVPQEQKPLLLDPEGLSRTEGVSVRDTQVSVLYVDGYPRWEYRYLKTEMIREKSVNVSCLLASADAKFPQEGSDRVQPDGKSLNMRITKFPDSLQALENYDVLIIGDVDPRYFTDSQLQIINEFVQAGRGFEMIAGPRFSPQAYRNTPIEPLLPVSINKVVPTDPNLPISTGFRPVVTKTGETTSIFRFEPDKDKNDAFLKDQIPLLFWYCRGVTPKPSVGEVLAEHPLDRDPVGHKAPILVAGRFGGRTIFNATDESWRWRYYTGESNFDKYWVQQIRYLARNNNIDQGHQLNLTADQKRYELGQQIKLTLKVLDPVLGRQLSDHIGVELVEDKPDGKGEPVRNDVLILQDGADTRRYTASFTADRIGKFKARVKSVAANVPPLEASIDVMLPRLELDDPTVDHVSLDRLAAETVGKSLTLADATPTLTAIPSAEKIEPITSPQPLWGAPITLIVFMLLVGCEWVTRKLFGMV